MWCFIHFRKFRQDVVEELKGCLDCELYIRTCCLLKNKVSSQKINSLTHFYCMCGTEKDSLAVDNR